MKLNSRSVCLFFAGKDKSEQAKEMSSPWRLMCPSCGYGDGLRLNFSDEKKLEHRTTVPTVRIRANLENEKKSINHNSAA